MKIFSTFTGIGGFEVGIQNAYRSAVRRSEKDSEGINEEGAGFFPTKGKDSGSSQRSVGERVADKSYERPLCVGYSEIDKYASSVYERHFPGVRNYGDITKINAAELPNFDCLVGGFPCQAFSIAGKRRGFEDTRGTLFFDLARILGAKRPRLFVFENVKGLLSHDDGNTFKTIVAAIDELGYDCQWQVLNSKNHGVPQNRERVIIVGHLRGTTRPEVFPLEGNGGSDIVLPTLTTRYAAAQANGGYISDQSEERCSNLRRLTPKECERLQAFPDDWTKFGKDGELISDTQRYKMCGNAVTTNVIRDVFERILAS